MNYYKRDWDETTGDELTDNWGTSIYYFEIGSDNYPIRQIQLFSNGKALKYNDELIGDDYGGQSDQLFDTEEFQPFKIDKSEFESVWTNTKHL